MTQYIAIFIRKSEVVTINFGEDITKAEEYEYLLRNKYKQLYSHTYGYIHGTQYVTVYSELHMNGEIE